MGTPYTVLTEFTAAGGFDRLLTSTHNFFSDKQMTQNSMDLGILFVFLTDKTFVSHISLIPPPNACVNSSG